MNQKILLPILLFTLIIEFSGCASNAPRWSGHIWAGDSKTAAIRRAQNNEAIPASSPAFDNYACMTYDDFLSLYTTYVLGCQTWKSTASSGAATANVSKNQVIRDFDQSSTDPTIFRGQ